MTKEDMEDTSLEEEIHTTFLFFNKKSSLSLNKFLITKLNLNV